MITMPNEAIAAKAELHTVKPQIHRVSGRDRPIVRGSLADLVIATQIILCCLQLSPAGDQLSLGRLRSVMSGHETANPNRHGVFGGHRAHPDPLDRRAVYGSACREKGACLDAKFKKAFRTSDMAGAAPEP